MDPHEDLNYLDNLSSVHVNAATLTDKNGKLIEPIEIARALVATNFDQSGFSMCNWVNHTGNVIPIATMNDVGLRYPKNGHHNGNGGGEQEGNVITASVVNVKKALTSDNIPRVV